MSSVVVRFLINYVIISGTAKTTDLKPKSMHKGVATINQKGRKKAKIEKKVRTGPRTCDPWWPLTPQVD